MTVCASKAVILDVKQQKQHVLIMLRLLKQARQGYVVVEQFTARLTCLTHRPVTNVCVGCGFDPSSWHKTCCTV
jgi:hypothetical protein